MWYAAGYFASLIASIVIVNIGNDKPSSDLMLLGAIITSTFWIMVAIDGLKKSISSKAGV